MNIGIASDHRGFKLKQKLTKYLSKRKYNVIDYGTDSTDVVDYPDFVLKLGNAINKKEVETGIVICGSGIGVCIFANKIKNIRCAKVDNIKEAKLSRNDSDANVIALNGTMSTMKAKDLIDVFLKTPFSNMDRYIRRIKKISKYEQEGIL
jgi:ribose 5-phosphate isomerase B